TLVYRVRIDSPLADGTSIEARAQIASQETAAFTLDSASLTVRAVPDFADDRTTLSVEPSHDVRPGGRVIIVLSAFNAGPAAAEVVSATVDLPDSLLPVRGATRIDGRAVRAGKKESLTFDLGRIDAQEQVELRCEAVVASPLGDGAVLDISALLEWQ